MSLPSVAIQTFNIELPMSKKVLECRPYLVKEDKILLMAAESKDPKEIAMATRNVLNACVITPGFDSKTIPSVDADFLFINLRAKSVSEKVKLDGVCANLVKTGVDESGEAVQSECGEKFSITIDLPDIKLTVPGKTILADIKIGEGIGIKLKPTTFAATLDYVDGDDITKNINILYNSLECIYDKDTIHTPKDITKAEFAEWILNLTKESYIKMVEYIDNLPSLEIEKNHTCTKCGFKHELRFDSPLDFF